MERGLFLLQNGDRNIALYLKNHVDQIDAQFQAGQGVFGAADVVAEVRRRGRVLRGGRSQEIQRFPAFQNRQICFFPTLEWREIFQNPDRSVRVSSGEALKIRLPSSILSFSFIFGFLIIHYSSSEVLILLVFCYQSSFLR